MSKFTPGPWKVGESIGANIVTKTGEMRACFTVIEADGFIAGSGVAMAHIKPDADESNANARLIAAAPDLLAALEWMVSAYTDEDDSGPFIQRARAAIAKATGE